MKAAISVKSETIAGAKSWKGNSEQQCNVCRNVGGVWTAASATTKSQKNISGVIDHGCRIIIQLPSSQ